MIWKAQSHTCHIEGFYARILILLLANLAKLKFARFLLHFVTCMHFSISYMITKLNTGVFATASAYKSNQQDL